MLSGDGTNVLFPNGHVLTVTAIVWLVPLPSTTTTLQLPEIGTTEQGLSVQVALAPAQVVVML